MVLTIDQIEGPGELQKIHFTVAATLDTSDITLTITTDLNGDGLLSDESPKSHIMVVSYLDEDQLIHDLTWTKSALGRGGGNVALETGETVELTVELQRVNPIPIARTAMIIMLRPVMGAAITIERRAPNNISTTMTLDRPADSALSTVAHRPSTLENCMMRLTTRRGTCIPWRREVEPRPVRRYRVSPRHCPPTPACDGRLDEGGWARRPYNDPGLHLQRR